MAAVCCMRGCCRHVKSGRQGSSAWRLGLLLGLFLVGLRGIPLLLIGLIGVVGGLFYAGWPLYLSSRVVEDAAVFVGLGPLLVLGAFDTLTGHLHVVPFLVSLPLGLPRRVNPPCQPSANVFCRRQRKDPHPGGGVGMGESTAALLCSGRSAICSGGAADPRGGAAGVGLVDISEPSFGGAKRPSGVACHSGPDHRLSPALIGRWHRRIWPSACC